MGKIHKYYILETMSPVLEKEIYQILEDTNTQIVFQNGGYCRCKFDLLDENNKLHFRPLQKFLNFCAKRNISIRSKRNQTVLMASFGAVFSDMKSSEAFRQALHISSHPKDRPKFSSHKVS